MSQEDFDARAFQNIYNWVDQIPFSRPKKNIWRDFSDGVMVAELIQHYYPHLVDRHNYVTAHSLNKKRGNWETLNRKVFVKLRFQLSEETILKLCAGTRGSIERCLAVLRGRINAYQQALTTGERLAEPRLQCNPTSSPKLPQISTYCRPRLDAGANSRIAGPHGASLNPGAFGDDGKFIPVHNNEQTVRNLRPNPCRESDLQRVIVNGIPMVPELLLAERDQMLLNKEETIQLLLTKIKRLQQLLELRELKIQQLSRAYSQ